MLSSKHNPRMHRVESLIRVADGFDPECKDSYKDIAELFGESTYKFETIKDLVHFLADQEGREMVNNGDGLGLERIKKLKAAIGEYEQWKVEEQFKEQSSQETIKTLIDLKNTAPKGIVTHLTDLVAVSQGLEYVRHIVRAEANDLLESIGKDREIEERKRRLALSLLKFALNVVNAGIAVDVLHEAVEHTVEAEKALLAVLAAETLKEFSYMTDEQLTRYMEERFGGHLSSHHIDKLLDVLWNYSIRFLDKNIKYSVAIDKPLTEPELESLIATVQQQYLLPALEEAPHPQIFNYDEFVAKTIAKQLKEKNESLLKVLKDSSDKVETEAKTVVTLEGDADRESLRHFMLRHFNSGHLTRDYFKDNPKFKYDEVKVTTELPGYKLMHRACDNTNMYFPVTMDPEVMLLLQPKPPKSKIQLTHKMHVGGKHARHHVYGILPDLKDPIFGYKKDGKYKQKDRIRDTWRADHIVQMVLTKSIHVSANPHVFLPFPTFKSVQEIGDAVINILKVNPNFRGGNYEYKEGEPHPTPLYLITHMDDYKGLLDRPGVKEYILRKMETNLILQSLTDLNVKGVEDKPRMMQAMKDTFFFLEKIGYDQDKLNYIRGLCQGYIELQCATPARITRMKKLTKEIEACLKCSGPYDMSDELGLKLKKNQTKIAKLIKVCEELRKNVRDNKDRILLIEKIIISDLTGVYHDVETAMAFDKVLPKLLRGDDFNSDEMAVVKKINDQKTNSLSPKDRNKIYNLVKNHIEEQEGLEQLRTFQTSFLASPPDDVALTPAANAPAVALAHDNAKSCANDEAFVKTKQHNLFS